MMGPRLHSFDSQPEVTPGRWGRGPFRVGPVLKRSRTILREGKG